MSGRFDRPWYERPNAPAPGTALCRVEEVSERDGKGFVFGDGGQAFEMFAVRFGTEVRGYVNQCPHFKIALNAHPDMFVNGRGEIMCAWHYARFRPRDGYCFDGPCDGQRLVRVPLRVDGDTIRIGRPEAPAQAPAGAESSSG